MGFRREAADSTKFEIIHLTLVVSRRTPERSAGRKNNPASAQAARAGLLGVHYEGQTLQK